MDGSIIELLDEAVRWAEDRYGRRGAWIAAIGGLLLIVGGIAALLYFYSP